MSDSHRYLAEATATVDLVTCLPDGSGHRYHRVLRDHLRLVLAQERGPAGALAQYGRAASLLADKQHWDAALVGYCRAGRWDDASDVVGRHGGRLTLSGAGRRRSLARDGPAGATPGWRWSGPAACSPRAGRTRPARWPCWRETPSSSPPIGPCASSWWTRSEHFAARRHRQTDPWPILSATDGVAGRTLSDAQRATWQQARRALTHLAAGRLRDARKVLRRCLV